MADRVLLPPTGASVPSGGLTPFTVPGKYRVVARVVTRAGAIPVKGVRLTLDQDDLGRSDAEGKVPVSDVRSDVGFTLTAEYANAEEHLKTERGEIRLSNLDLGKMTFDAQVAHEIHKNQDIVGDEDINFKDTWMFSVPGTDIRIEKASDGVFDLEVIVKLATLSLQVPYLNQNFQDETVTTISGKDPELKHTHAVSPKIKGSWLCFPTSLTMLLNYWGVAKSRTEIMQEIYQQWSNYKFEGRNDQDAVRGQNPPLNKNFGQYWLDDSTVDPTHGYTMKKWGRWEKVEAFTGNPDFSQKASPGNPRHGQVWKDISKKAVVYRRAVLDWSIVEDVEWRVKRNGTAIWEVWNYEEKVLKALRPADTKVRRQFENKVKVEGLPKNVLKEPFLGYLRDRLIRGLPTVVSTTATAGHVMIVRGCVADASGNVRWLIANDPYGRLAARDSTGHYEKNDLGNSNEGTMKGKHVYYNGSTKGRSRNFELKGRHHGGLALVKVPAFSREEVAQKLTPGAEEYNDGVTRRGDWYVA